MGGGLERAGVTGKRATPSKHTDRVDHDSTMLIQMSVDTTRHHKTVTAAAPRTGETAGDEHRPYLIAIETASVSMRSAPNARAHNGKRRTTPDNAGTCVQIYASACRRTGDRWNTRAVGEVPLSVPVVVARTGMV